jgi:bla regulator protein BlaR1
MSWLLVPLLKNAILVLPLALLALAAARWSRRPALAHLLWVLVLIKLVTPPLINVPLGWRLDVETWLGLAEDASKGIQATAHSSADAAKADTWKSTLPRPSRRRPDTLIVAALQPADPAQKTSWSAMLPRGETRLQLLAAIWLGGSMFVAVSLAWRAWRFHQYLCRVARHHETLGPRVGELAQEARIGISPQVVVIEGIMSPALWTLGRRACLIFPARLADRLGPEELDALLLHELSHFARADHWVRVLELACQVLFWWHPVVWLARYQIEAAEEQCCDAWVVEHQHSSRHAYAQALLATIDFLHDPAHLPPLACGLGEVPLLRARLIQIMRGNIASRLPRVTTALVLAAGLAISPLEPALWAHSSSSPKKTRAAEKVPRSAPSNRRDSRVQKAKSEFVPISLTTPAASSGSPSSKSIARGPLTPPILIWASATSPDGKFKLEARAGRRTTLAQAATNFRLDMSAHGITCAAFARDSITFATGHEDHLVRRWDSETGGLLQSYRGCESPITSVQQSPDGRWLAAGTSGGQVLVWDVESADETARFTASPLAVSCLRWSARADRLAIAAGDWSSGENATLYLWSPPEDTLLAEQKLAEPAGALDWLPDDDGLLIAAWNGQGRVWKLATSEFARNFRLEKDAVSAAAWSPDCPLVMPASSEELEGSEPGK